MPLRDPHSFYNPLEPRMVHCDWTLRVDFDAKKILGTTTITFDKNGKTNLDLRGISITEVTDSFGQAIEFTLCENHPILGQCLTTNVPSNLQVKITYETSTDASALQWLAANQTLGKRHPFLFSQAQAIHARSFLPCQDTPGIRFTYSAKLIVPRELRGLMAASTYNGREENQGIATESWQMNQPIPAYLLAFAVGDVVSHDISPLTRVWAEPEIVAEAAEEFTEVPHMMETAEKLFGPYLWDRFDLLILPPSSPFGAMENPCLTFVSPTLLTGDKSLTYVLAHELAHSWTGNLITNATWQDFWLNEGWTTYAQWRISEVLYGKEHTTLQMALFEREMNRDQINFFNAGESQFTALTYEIPSSIDPDETSSLITYCKGALFLILVEKTVGRDHFDAFIRKYIHNFSFQSLSTSEFLTFLENNFPGISEEIQAHSWIYEPGVPKNAPPIESTQVNEVTTFATKNLIPPLEAGICWNNLQWTLYLELLPRPIHGNFIKELNETFSLSKSPSIEVRWAILLLAIEGNYAELNEDIEIFLQSTGRLKYLLPLYKAITTLTDGLAWAHRLFKQTSPNYHPIATIQIERLLLAAEKTLAEK